MKPGDDARKALHDLRWGSHIADVGVHLLRIERQEQMDRAIGVALDTIAKLEALEADVRACLALMCRKGPPTAELEAALTSLNNRLEELETGDGQG